MTTRTIQGLLIAPSGQMSVLEFNPRTEGLRILQEAVGGYIEGFGHPTGEATWHGYLNETGKIEGLPANPFAIVACDYDGIDVLCGPVVLVGQVDDEGYDTSLDDLTAQRVRRAVREVHERADR